MLTGRGADGSVAAAFARGAWRVGGPWIRGRRGVSGWVGGLLKGGANGPLPCGRGSVSGRGSVGRGSVGRRNQPHSVIGRV